MRNNKGYSVLLVMMLLGIMSLVGSGLILMSRLDLNFTGALRNYDKMFNLADGACGMGYNDLCLVEHPTNFTRRGPAPYGPICNNLPEQGIGNYNVMLWEQDYDDDPSHLPGLPPNYHIEMWTGEGRAVKQTGTLMVESSMYRVRPN
jgi:hypothetical protein